MRLKSSLVAVGMAAALVLTGCAAGSTDSGDNEPGAALTIAKPDGGTRVVGVPTFLRRCIGNVISMILSSTGDHLLPSSVERRLQMQLSPRPWPTAKRSADSASSVQASNSWSPSGTSSGAYLYWKNDNSHSASRRVGGMRRSISRRAKAPGALGAGECIGE